MTREEKLAILIYDSVWTEEAESVFVEKVKSAIKNFLDNENPWHKALEELPEKGGHYLCMDENKNIEKLAFCGTKWVNTSQFIDVSLDVVLYWMPIPELPKEEEK